MKPTPSAHVPHPPHPSSGHPLPPIRGRRTGSTAIELSIETPGVGRPLPARNERGEGRGEGKSEINATPLPGPLLLLRRKRGRRAQSMLRNQCRWRRGEGLSPLFESNLQSAHSESIRLARRFPRGIEAL